MQQATATPATPLDGNYRIEHYHTRTCIRLHCEPAPAGDAPSIVAERCPPQQATRFPSREAAEAAAHRYLPYAPVEIVRVDA
jgi:hypothetical protein